MKPWDAHTAIWQALNPTLSQCLMWMILSACPPYASSWELHMHMDLLQVLGCQYTVNLRKLRASVCRPIFKRDGKLNNQARQVWLPLKSWLKNLRQQLLLNSTTISWSSKMPALVTSMLNSVVRLGLRIAWRRITVKCCLSGHLSKEIRKKRRRSKRSTPTSNKFKKGETASQAFSTPGTRRSQLFH